jgi:hypothetical protein
MFKIKKTRQFFKNPNYFFKNYLYVLWFKKNIKPKIYSQKRHDSLRVIEAIKNLLQLHVFLTE